MDIRNKNELRRRIDAFLHEYTHEEYIINEEFCKDTMRMMEDFIGHVDGRMDSERKRLTEGSSKRHYGRIKFCMNTITMDLPESAGQNLWEICLERGTLET